MLKRSFQDRLQLTFHKDSCRRVIASKDIIVHCHHYNARLQSIIESASEIDGKDIIVSTAELVFSQQLNNIIEDTDSLSDKWQLAADLHAQLGLGLLDFSDIDNGIITASSSHAVKGWQSAFTYDEHAVCSITQGYLQGVIFAITADVVSVHEFECLNMGEKVCTFTIDNTRTSSFTTATKTALPSNALKTLANEHILINENINEDKIISALVNMPIYGNEEGLIPTFGVYLANLPADFYNLITIRFIQEMKKIHRYSTAIKLLVFAGEVCALNTFKGIIQSPEWEALIAPMIKKEDDALFSLIAVSNALGWGNWQVSEYKPEEYLILRTVNGYESEGYMAFCGYSSKPECYMLKGVSAGIMDLFHADGTIEDKLGNFYTEETQCLCNEGKLCEFTVKAV